MFRRETGEDPQAPDLAEKAAIRPHTLTEELLDWLLAALEAVIRTPEVQAAAHVRARQSLYDAYKYADHLYPLTLGVTHADTLREGEGLVLGLERALQGQEEGRAGSEGSLRPRLQEGEVDGDGA